MQEKLFEMKKNKNDTTTTIRNTPRDTAHSQTVTKVQLNYNHGKI